MFNLGIIGYRHLTGVLVDITQNGSLFMTGNLPYGTTLAALRDNTSSSFGLTPFPNSVGWNLTQQFLIGEVDIRQTDSQYGLGTFRVDGSNDGTNWTKIPITGYSGIAQAYNTNEGQMKAQTGWGYFTLQPSVPYSKVRLWCYTNIPGGGSDVYITEAKLWQLT